MPYFMNRLIYILLLFPILTFGQEEIVFEDYVYVTNIKSVKFNPQGRPLDMPVAYMSGGLPLELSFDDLDNEARDYTYEIIHCDRNWQPSRLSPFEYLDGIQEGDINDFNNSSTTLVPYINYRLTLPNRFYKWTKSGNYLLVIYEGDKEDELPVISRRFMVVDNQLSLISDGRRPVDIKHFNAQFFDLTLDLNKNIRLSNPLSSVSTSILQNGRWDNAVIDARPLFEMGNKIIIDNKGTYAFQAGNEFRALDIRSLEYGSNGIHSIDLEEGKTRVFLDLNHNRNNTSYITYPDADGQFIIGTRDSNFANTEDYAEVIFTVKSPKLKEEVYVIGAFTDWKMEDTYKMEYNEKHGAYVGMITLKQGFYDYAFAVNKDGVADLTTFEGNKYQTNNKYQIFTYYKRPGGRYDQLIGFSTFKSSIF